METRQVTFIGKSFSKNEAQEIILYFKGDFLMKKTLAAAITSALVIGVASTTFAAANPFSDVPTDHWSFDAVAKLAHEGVIEGYGDNTFRGDAKITRYEMAQMVAKAMAKSNVSAADKATIDKLSAEYASELNNLGVRVSALEKKTDNVKFSGYLRLDTTHKTINDHRDPASGTASNLRLFMDAAVNDSWAVKARINTKADLDNDDPAVQDRQTRVDWAYAQGPLFGATAKIGRFGGFDNAGYTAGGMLLDNPVEGAEFAWQTKALTTKVTTARIADGDYDYAAGGSSEYDAIQFDYKASNKLKLAAGYHHIGNSATTFGTDDANNIWNAGFDYKFNKNLTLGGFYAGSSADATATFGNAASSDEENSYTAQLTYKGVKQNAPGSFGIWAGYRQIGKLATLHPTYDDAAYGDKGFQVGAQYMLDKNIMAYVDYFKGEKITSGDDVEKVFGRLQFSF